MALIERRYKTDTDIKPAGDDSGTSVPVGGAHSNQVIAEAEEAAIRAGQPLPPAPGGAGQSVMPPSGGVTVIAPQVLHTPEQLDHPYITDWKNGFGAGIAHGAAREQPLWSVMRDYDRWAEQNGGKPLDAISKYLLFTENDPNKSIADNEKAERRRKNQEKWEQIGNALSHVGNFMGTIMGAPSQQLETGTVLTERQRRIHDAMVQQRQKTAGDLLSLWYKDRADERAAELNNANIGYKNQQTTYLGNKDQREGKESDAKVKYYDAGTAQRLSAKELNDARTKTEDELRAPRIETEKGKQAVQSSQVARNKAGAAASYASADASRARANETRQKSHDEMAEFAEWEKAYPEEAEEFKRQNGLETGRRGTGKMNETNAKRANRKFRARHPEGYKASKKKTIAGFGGKGNKKSITGFGGH